MSKPSFFIALLTVELMIPQARSLKDKRREVQGLRDRIRHRFNASVSEVGYHDKWQRSLLAVCMVSGDKRQLESEITLLRTLCEEATELMITEMSLEWL